jgi:hypothetical protein
MLAILISPFNTFYEKLVTTMDLKHSFVDKAKVQRAIH